MNRASIDIGSNSLLLLVLAPDGTVLHDEARVVGLGRGLGDRGLFRPDRMEAAAAVIEEYVRVAEEHGVSPPSIRAVATSAARRAMNAQTFFDRFRDSLGLVIRTISGEEEARLTWLGAMGGLPLPDEGPVAVIDLGGGSTEVVLGHGDQIGMRHSLELGSVRLTEQFFGGGVDRYNHRDLARLRDHIQAQVGLLRWPARPRALIAVAGTATTLAAMEQGLRVYSRQRVHGYRLSRKALQNHVDRLFNSSAEERRALAASSPERADYLLAGASVLEAICTSVHRDSLRISDGGIRHGLLAPGA